MSYHVKVPRHIAQWLENWAPPLLECLYTALVEHAGNECSWPSCLGPSPLHGLVGTGPSSIRVGTDCSGLDAPIFALKGLDAAFEHIFSCEISSAPRSMIQANFQPRQLLCDVHRSAQEIPGFVHLYVAGFSCKPFSLMHHGTRLLEEAQAQVFKSVLQRLQRLRPPVFVLENVQGIQRCMEDVVAMLENMETKYDVVVQLMDPTDVGEPLLRPRFYFLGIRSDVAKFSKAEAMDLVRNVWASVRGSLGSSSRLESRLLPNNHWVVAKMQEARQKQCRAAKASGFSGGKSGECKWTQRHDRWAKRASKTRTKGTHACTADDLFLHLPRERDVWKKLTQAAGEEAHSLVCDLSQSLGRNRERVDGKLPTICPGSKTIVGPLGRALAPAETILLHSFPLHLMSIPEAMTDNALASMGGNTMHVQIVAAAMVLAMCLVDWTKPDAARDFRDLETVCQTKQAINANKAKTKRKATASWKKTEQALLARFGLAQTTLPNKKRGQNLTLASQKQWSCYDGTRWAAAKV